jgi:circadian clock protein KaiC
VLSILVMSQHGMLGQMSSPVDVTYLADTVVMMRFYETRGRRPQALSVLKKRTGPTSRPSASSPSVRGSTSESH